MAKELEIGDKYVTPMKHLKVIQELNKNYTIGNVIGKGKYGVVCEGKMGIAQNIEIAVKIIDLTKTSKEYQQKFFPNELKALDELRQTYIVTVYNTKLYESTFYVFMEKAFGGDIINMLEEKEFLNGIPEPRTKALYRMITSALKFIHNMGSAHRDVKSENILLMNKERTIAKITDFGFSTICSVPKNNQKVLRETYCGTPNYSPPEIERHQPYDAMKADVWSLGVVLYIMLQNEMPLTSIDIFKLAKDPKPVKIEFKNKNLSKECKDLIIKQLEIDPKKRLTMTQVSDHQWLR